MADISSGGTPATNVKTYWDGGIAWVTLVDSKQKYLTATKRTISKAGLENSSAKLLPVNTVIFSSRATIGDVTVAKIETCTNQGYKNFVCHPDKIHYEYLYYMLCRYKSEIEELAGGMTYKEISKEKIAAFKIPLPPLDIQEQLVRECATVDNSVVDAKSNIDLAQQQIESVINAVFGSNFPVKKLGNADIARFNPSKSELKTVNDDTQVSFVEMAVVSESGFITNPVDRALIYLRKGSYTYFSEDDIIIAKITPCMENGKCALATGLTNGIGMGSSEFHVIRANQANVLPAYLFALLNRQAIRSEAEKVMTGSSGHRRVPASFYENLSLPIPTIDEQNLLVSEIELLEKNIIKSQKIIDTAQSIKAGIMQKYLF